MNNPALSLFNFMSAVETADKWLEQFPTVIQQRKALAVTTKPNPVTKVAERLAEVDEDECVVGSPVGTIIGVNGEAFLANIHDEIDAVNVDDLCRHVANNRDDAISAIHLNCARRFEEAEEEAREQERKQLSRTFA